MTAKTKLTPTQQAIVDAMRKGATIRCYRGKFWITDDASDKCAGDVREGTIDKLISSRVIQYTKMNEYRVSIYELTPEYQEGS